MGRPESLVANGERPCIFDHVEMRSFCSEMLGWLRQTEPGFSVRRECRNLSRCSPSLVTLYLKGERQVSADRAHDLARLLRLSGRESRYLAACLSAGRSQARRAGAESAPDSEAGMLDIGRQKSEGFSGQDSQRPDQKRRTRGQAPRPNNSIVSHWLHMYVKDSARLRGFLPEPSVVQRLLGGMASPQAIARSLRFLFREGYLRRTLDGRVVENNVLDETTDGIPSRHIRQVHKRALDIARACIDSVPPGQREASVILLPLTQKHFLELKDIVKRWAEEGAGFAEAHSDDDERLYQLVINLSPVGGSFDAPEGPK